MVVLRSALDPASPSFGANRDAMAALEVIRAVRQTYPQAHLTMGLSNISFGLPARSYINRAFLTLALQAGLDSAIIDPLDRELIAALTAATLVLGRDRHCLNYTRAYRAGLLGEKP